MVMGWEGYVFALYVSTHINALGETTKDKNFIICLWVFKKFQQKKCFKILKS